MCNFLHIRYNVICWWISFTFSFFTPHFSFTYVLFLFYYASKPTYTTLSHITVEYLPTLWFAYSFDTECNQIFNKSMLLDIKTSHEHQKIVKLICCLTVWKITPLETHYQTTTLLSHTLCNNSYFSSGPFFSQHNIVGGFFLAWAVHFQALPQYLKRLKSSSTQTCWFLFHFLFDTTQSDTWKLFLNPPGAGLKVSLWLPLISF